MVKKSIIILVISCFSLIGVGQTLGVDRYGEKCQSGCFFINQYGGEMSRPRLNWYGHLLGYPPEVTTDSIRLNGLIHIDLYGTVGFDGWSNVTQRGFQYSTSANFDNATTIAAGSGTGGFHNQITSLSPNTTYYCRAFANNQYGTSYGNTFSTQTAIGDLVLGEIIRGISSNSFNIRIPILDNGGAPVSGKICAYTDPSYSQLFACQNITPTTSSSIFANFPNTLPGTEYYVEAVITNTKDTLTRHTYVSFPTDLSVRVYQGTPSTSYGCDPPEGRNYHYYVSISGNDPRKEEAEILWDYNGGTSTMSDTNLIIWVNEIFTLSVTASIVVGRDTIAAPNTISVQTDGVTRTQASCSCCGEEFNNSMSCSGNVIAYTWVDENTDTVATTSSVTLPRGDYTLWYTDGYGCSFSKPVHIGPQIRHCTIEGDPLPNESAHMEDGVWVLDSVKDHQDNWYIIKQYGSQCWMRQSMRCTTSPSGRILLNSNITNIRAIYYNNAYAPEKAPQYGLRYTVLAAFDTTFNTSYDFNLGENWRGICPIGWHIPSWEECVALTECVVHQKDSTLVITPAAVPSNNAIGTNLRIGIWLTDNCNSYQPDNNWAEFSLMRSGSGTSVANAYYFLTTRSWGGNDVFCGYEAKRGPSGVAIILQYSHAPITVRCLRNQ